MFVLFSRLKHRCLFRYSIVNRVNLQRATGGRAAEPRDGRLGADKRSASRFCGSIERNEDTHTHIHVEREENTLTYFEQIRTISRL